MLEIPFHNLIIKKTFQQSDYFFKKDFLLKIFYIAVNKLKHIIRHIGYFQATTAAIGSMDDSECSYYTIKLKNQNILGLTNS